MKVMKEDREGARLTKSDTNKDIVGAVTDR